MLRKITLFVGLFIISAFMLACESDAKISGTIEATQTDENYLYLTVGECKKGEEQQGVLVDLNTPILWENPNILKGLDVENTPPWMFITLYMDITAIISKENISMQTPYMKESNITWHKADKIIVHNHEMPNHKKAGFCLVT